MKFWQNVSYTEIDQLPRIAQHAEGLGFHGLTISDHIVTPETIRSPYPYTSDGKVWWDPGAPLPEPWTLATWLGAITTELRFMSYVYILGLRDPFNVAKLLSTAATLTNNRIELGLGIGWMKDEFDLVDLRFEDRGQRVDEMLDVIRDLVAGGMVERDGRFFRFPRVQMSPVPTEPIPVLVGGNSDAALRRAARNDGWLGIFYGEDEIPGVIGEVERYRAEYGTTGRPFEYLVFPSGEIEADTYKRLAERGVTAAINPPWYYGLGLETSPIDVKLAAMDEFARTHIAPLSRP